MDILCRVPIQTLTASKSVCKLWLHLITDPQFPHLHQPKAPTQVCFQQFQDHNTVKLHMGNFNFLTNHDPLHVKLNTVFQFPKFNVSPNNGLNYKDKKGTFYFANSCNGLLCYYGDSTNMFAVVWNPCTSEFITFPAPKPRNALFTCRGYGLGYSTKANKYKLMRVMGRKDIWSSAEVAVAEVCTIEKPCSWKTVGPCPDDVWQQPIYTWCKKDTLYATFLQGTLHWVGSSDSTKTDMAIHTFDFEDDRFGRLPLPHSYVQNCRNMVSFRRETLGVLADCLFILDFRDEDMSIWLMKEYGVQDSWTKLFCLGYPLNTGLRYDRCLPITYMDNGEILMKCTDSFATTDSFCTTVISYNPVLKSVRVIGSGPVSLRVIAFKPTIVSLKDSMMGYDVRVKPICGDAKKGDPNWWEPVEEETPPEKHVSQLTREAKVRAAGSRRAGRVCFFG